MNFHLEERPPGWSRQAPIQIRTDLFLPAAPERVFGVLADTSRWSTWFKGMRRVRIDGSATGIGALRTVWVGATRVQERFTVWEPGRQISLHVVGSAVPGLRVMVEDYRISPEGAGSRLTITVGVEATGLLRSAPWLVRFVVGRLTSGALGIATVVS